MIGRGGMGSVWEGRHTSLGTRVAIKFIEKEYADSEEARSRFDNEARAAATHPIEARHPDPRPRRHRRRQAVHRHGDARRRAARQAPRARRRSLSLRDTARILQQVCRGLQTRARARHRPPRHQAREHLHRAQPGRRRRDRQGARLRHREDPNGAAPIGHHLEQHEHGRGARHAVLHVARASARPARHRSSYRPLVARRHRVQVHRRGACRSKASRSAICS